MPDQVITGTVTTQVDVEGGTTTYIAPGALVATIGVAAIDLNPTGTEARLLVHGTITAISETAIDFSFSSLTPTYLSVEIGSTGVVAAPDSSAIAIGGYGSHFVNHGEVTALGTAVSMGATIAVNPSVGQNAPTTFTNTGTISGRDGVYLSGYYYVGLNTGTITGNNVAIGLAGGGAWMESYGGRFANSGTIGGGNYGFALGGDFAKLTNTGQILAGTGEGVRLAAWDQRFVNSGLIQAGSDGIMAGQGTDLSTTPLQRLTLIHSGQILAVDDGIEVRANASHVRSTGSIEAGDIGLYYSGTNARLITDGTVTAGTTGVQLLGDNASATLDGRISAGGTGVDVTGSGADIEVSARIRALGDNGIRVEGNAPTIDTSGQVTALNGVALYVLADDAIVNNSGSLRGFYGMILSFVDLMSVSNLYVTNSGTIHGSAGGISSDQGYLRLLNTGSITSATNFALQTSETAQVTNHGLIGTGPDGLGAISFDGGGSDTLRNFGTIPGDVAMVGGNDILRNGGQITGDIDLGDNDDLYNERGGTVSGVVDGGKGKDTLIGGDGAETLAGGQGYDILTGGDGADVFRFRKQIEVDNSTNADAITDFQSGNDKIDLSGFMNNAEFIGSAAFTAANQIRYDASLGYIYGNTDANLVLDWVLVLSNRPAGLTAADFIL